MHLLLSLQGLGSARRAWLYCALFSLGLIPSLAAQSLLPPDGPFSVGTILYQWTDATRLEGATPTPDDLRELVVQIWYPAPPSVAPPAPYVPRLSAYQGVWTQEVLARSANVRTHAVRNAPIAPTNKPYPVLLFSHGWQATRVQYTSLLQSLASHGYVVVGIDHPYMGRVALTDTTVTPSTEGHFEDPFAMLAYYAADQRFVLDQLEQLHTTDPDGRFAGQLDLSHVGTMGHSNGAFPALEAARTDARIQACLLFDKFENELGFLYVLPKPLLLFRTDPKTEAPAASFVAQLTQPVTDLFLAQATHTSVMDATLWLPAAAEQAFLHMDLLRTYTLHFFNTHLKQAPPFSVAPKDQPQLTLKIHRPTQK